MSSSDKLNLLLAIPGAHVTRRVNACLRAVAQGEAHPPAREILLNLAEAFENALRLDENPPPPVPPDPPVRWVGEGECSTVENAPD